ncbi:MAG: hypothetical protein ACD_78C00320G0018 [uncultured bacterium (gcode 4)]|uniref:Uncharacterized protein n=1 Tax=uncultured bacterium (gcode 4) TaxID=1234023 RepID=K1YWP5_9BACT|nr:MAG: hypothetical protein ACD_78C00320G0018 [uncultured bacterium (gcode 4)]
MHLSTLFDPEASVIADQLTFYCERFELSREDIEELKEKKLVRLVETDGLPKTIPCQVLVQCETVTRAKITFFNHTFVLPQAVYDDPFLNRDLIEASERHGGFWLEILVPLKDSGIELGFSYES